METNILIILAVSVLLSFVTWIIVYYRSFRFRTYGIIEIIPSRQKDDQELVLKMESFISNLKSMPLIEGSYNVYNIGRLCRKITS